MKMKRDKKEKFRKEIARALGNVTEGNEKRAANEREKKRQLLRQKMKQQSTIYKEEREIKIKIRCGLYSTTTNVVRWAGQ
jgi:septal ring factor EnvC (AmiA/AmiB activator)